MSENLLWAAAGCFAGAGAVILWIIWHIRNLWR